MIDPVNESDVHTGARVLDFRSPWNRRLWNVGLSLTLREVLEAAEAVSAGVLSPSSLNFLANVAQKIAGTDPAQERRVRLFFVGGRISLCGSEAGAIGSVTAW